MTIQFTNEHITEERRAMADKIKAGLTNNGKAFVEETKSGVYYDNLPEGFTKESIKTLDNFNGEYIKSAYVAVGELGGQELNEDSNKDKVEFRMNMGAGKLELNVHRSKTYPVPAKEGEERRSTTNELEITSKYSTPLGTGLKNLREAMSSEYVAKHKK